MNHRTPLSILIASAAMAASTLASAEIISFGGAVIDVTGSVTNSRVGMLESNTDIHVWNERQDYVLPMALWADLDGMPGTFLSPAALGNFKISAGTAVDSHFVHFDQIGPGTTVLSGDLSFPNEIIGVIITCDRLDVSDGVVGDPLVIYDDCWTNSRRTCDWDPGYAEGIQISSDRRTIAFKLITSNAQDEIRILTKALPDGGACPADFNNDNRVGVADLLSLLDVYGQCENCQEDLDGDGRVGITDLLKLIENWGNCDG